MTSGWRPLRKMVFIGLSLFVFSAGASDIVIDVVDQNYPADWVQKNTPFQVSQKPPAPWYHQAYQEKNEVLKVAGLQEAITTWSELEKDIFLDRLDRRGASGCQTFYPDLSLKQLRAAENKVREIKSRLPAGEAR